MLSTLGPMLLKIAAESLILRHGIMQALMSRILETARSWDVLDLLMLMDL